MLMPGLLASFSPIQSARPLSYSRFSHVELRSARAECSNLLSGFAKYRRWKCPGGAEFLQRVSSSAQIEGWTHCKRQTADHRATLYSTTQLDKICRVQHAPANRSEGRGRHGRQEHTRACCACQLIVQSNPNFAQQGSFVHISSWHVTEGKSQELKEKSVLNKSSGRNPVKLVPYTGPGSGQFNMADMLCVAKRRAEQGDESEVAGAGVGAACCRLALGFRISPKLLFADRPADSQVRHSWHLGTHLSGGLVATWPHILPL